MKTIYINEDIIKNKAFKRGILLNNLPNDIVDKISASRTSLGNNPSIPDISDVPFLLKVTEKGFIESRNALKEIEEINDISSTDLRSALSELLNRCRKTETPYRNELEKLCVNFIIDFFNVPEETVDINVELVDAVDFSGTTINLDPFDGGEDVEYNSIEDAKMLKDEVYKRRILNALCMGGAMRLSNCINQFADTLNKFDPSLVDLYRKIIAINQYLLFEQDEIGMDDDNKMQLGTVVVRLGNEDTKVSIAAQGVIFPILLCELFRGFLELFVTHGLPENKDMAMMVMEKSDFLKAEVWDMRLGPTLWDILYSTFKNINSEELPYLLKRLSTIKTKNFHILMQEIFAKTSKGKRIMAKYSAKAKDDVEYDKFVDKMGKLKSDTGIITDEFIHPDEL
jgi:hypothetical protein